ncbi:MAG TPA: dTDP-4-dehydrorhamnose reductase [Gemmatimonadaceae bacterium]
MIARTSRPVLLLLGATGQLGRELLHTLPSLGPLVAPSHEALDLASAADVRRFVRALRPSIVVNAAGYAFVDQAESEPAQCAMLNADVPALLARECRRLAATLIHFSTDYVFDGCKHTPYLETDATQPLSVYGRTKRDGERAVVDAGGAHFVVRTSWLHAAHGRNFPATIRRLAREREELRVVDDQIGAPTAAASVASGVRDMLRALERTRRLRGSAESYAGIYHMSAAGSTTWYEFARHILDGDPRREEHACREVRAISTDEYPTPARRPAYSVLDNTKLFAQFGIRLPSWVEQWRITSARLGWESRAAFAEAGAGHPADRTTM